VTGDKAIRGATSAVVCTVAVFAFVVSYSHIYDLGRAHGQAGTAARLLPLSVDGLILAASLVLLHEARHGRGAPSLARMMLWLGIAATVGANIAYGARYGLPGALISAWPAVAFIGSVEMVMQLVRRSRLPGAVAADPALPAAGPAGDRPPAVTAAAAALAVAGSTDAGAAGAGGTSTPARAAQLPDPEPPDVPGADGDQEDRDGPLIAAGIRIREQAAREGITLSRSGLASRLREQGHTIANGRRTWLWEACGAGSGDA
jgi:hypothetical protein